MKSILLVLAALSVNPPSASAENLRKILECRTVQGEPTADLSIDASGKA